METQSARRLGKSAELIANADASLALAQPGERISIATDDGWITVIKKQKGCAVTLVENGDKWTIQAANIKEGIQNVTAMQAAVLTILERGRAYILKDGERITLHVWHKDVNVVQNIKDVYGGNYYRHGSGFLYACSNRKILKKMWRSVNPRITDFENSRLTLLGDVEEA